MKTIILTVFAILFALTGINQTASAQDSTSTHHHTTQTTHKHHYTTKTHHHNYSNSTSHRNSASSTSGMNSENKSSNGTMHSHKTSKYHKSTHSTNAKDSTQQ